VIPLKADENGNNMLHHQAANGINVEPLSSLLSSGEYDINAKNNAGETPLLLACKNQKHGHIAELIRHGANPNIRDNAGNMPMDLVKGC
jgi:ankyrin repeat protein